MADRYFVDGGVDNNWGTIGNWSLTSGGAGGEAVPTSSDDVFFDGNSPNCTINASVRVGLSIDFTGYTNTITFSQQLTVVNAVTLAAGMTFAGSSPLRIDGPASPSTCTFTSNGKAVGVPFHTTGGNMTLTLADDMTCDAELRFDVGTGAQHIINGNTIHVKAAMTVSGGAGAGSAVGTTLLSYEGTGSWTCNGVVLGLSLTINTAGTLTVSGTNIQYGGSGTLTYTAGTVVTTSSHIRFSGTVTLDTDGISWNDASFNGNTTMTLTSQMLVTGTLSLLPSNTQTVTVNGSGITLTGSLIVNGFSGAAVGTTVITFAGTGTWSNPAGLSVPMTNPVVIDTAGTITVSGTVLYNTGTITYVSGTLAQTGTGTLRFNANTTTLDFGGASLGPVALLVNAAATLRLASDLTIDASGSLTLAGTNTGGNAVTLNSTSAGVQRALTVEEGATMSVRFTNPTDIDSSGGITVPYFQGTITNTLNWVNTTNIGRKDKPKGGANPNVQFPGGAVAACIGNPGVTVG